MRNWKLAAAATVASGLLAGGMFAAFNLTAQAATNACTWPPSGTTTGTPSCSITGYAMTDPLAVTFELSTTPGGVTIDLNWEIFCTDANNTNTSTVPGNTTVSIPAGATTGSAGSASYVLTNAKLPLTQAASCTLTTVTAKQDLTAPSGGTAPADVKSLGLTISYTEQSPPSPSASPTPSASTSSAAPKKYNNQVHGFDGTCLDDKGNSSAKRSAVILWQCDNADQAQGWTYSGSELKIHGMCLNAKGNGKSGSRLILWTCNGSGNEIFSHRSSGQFAEKANGYSLCIDDPGYKTKNGTQPIMYACNKGANQHWTKP
jgi:hypothetical protein